MRRPKRGDGAVCVIDQSGRQLKIPVWMVSPEAAGTVGIYRFAMQQGLFERANPVTAASIPDAPGPSETCAYSLEEVTQMVALLPEPAATIVLTAAFTGLRRGEIRGMRWENLESGEPLSFYRVSQSIWKSFVTEPKTTKFKAPVPIIGLLANAAILAWGRCSPTL